MSDKDFLNWPFLDDSHRKLSTELEAWCEQTLEKLPLDHSDVDAECRLLVTELGKAGFTANAVPAAYGGNTDGIGWRWLEYVPGFPLPGPGTRYAELPL